MKNLLLLFGLLFLGTQLSAQGKPASPPAEASAVVGGTTVTVKYSSPSVKGRKIWGALVPNGEVWRAGANETTIFSVSKDVMVEGKTLKAGSYGFFVIPNEKTWTVVINKTIAWGAYSYKKEDDIFRFDVPVQKTPSLVESLTYGVTDKGVVTLSWENAMISFNVK